MSKTEVTVYQMPAFKKVYKKLYGHQKLEVNKAIQNIISNPEVGESKKGDLVGVYIYKFKVDKQDMLLAYEWEPTTRLLLALGVHENFYRDLKRSR